MYWCKEALHWPNMLGQCYANVVIYLCDCWADIYLDQYEIICRFRFRKFETILASPLLNLMQINLWLPFNRIRIYRFITEHEIEKKKLTSVHIVRKNFAKLFILILNSLTDRRLPYGTPISCSKMSKMVKNKSALSCLLF